MIIKFYCALFIHCIATKDDDWQSARGTMSTSMHILSPTGFSIELRKSIVSDDALLPRYVLSS